MKSTWCTTFLILGLALSFGCGGDDGGTKHDPAPSGGASGDDDSDGGGDDEGPVGPATGAVCDKALTYDKDIAPLMTKYCISCHATSVPVAQRNGAPTDHNFETQAGVLKETSHIDQEAGSGPKATNMTMPPPALASKYPAPTTPERAILAQWIACQPASD
jgi:hypothetical protein